MSDQRVPRRCVRCGELKTAEAFSRSKNGRDGLHSYCRSCMSAYMKQRREPTAHSLRPCELCGSQFVPQDVRRRFCSKGCKQRARYWRANPRETRTCQVCGHDVSSLRRDAVFCSDNCAYEQRRRDGRVKQSARRQRISRYGLTEESFESLLAAQGGRCAICGAVEPGTHHGQWHIDHDHSCCPDKATDTPTCGRCVRGILCGQCNLGLGHFRDDPDLLAAAAGYLNRSLGFVG